MSENDVKSWNTRGDRQMMISLPEVRFHVVELMRNGYTEVPLQEFLIMLKDAYKTALDSETGADNTG